MTKVEVITEVAAEEAETATPIQEKATRNLHVAFFFGFIALGLIALALSEAGLAWDGYYVLYKLLDTQTPFVVHDRFEVILLQWPTLLVSYVSSDVSLLKPIFGLAYGLVPLVSLAASWWVVRNQRQSRSLFIWAAFGIGLGTLPGQVCLVADANMVLQLSWPIILAVLTGLRKPQIPVVVILVFVMFNTHPFSALLFGLFAALAFGIGWQRKAQRRYLWWWAGGFLAATGLVVLRFLLVHTSYETDQLTVATAQEHFSGAVLGLPLLAIVFSWLGGLAVFGLPLAKKSHKPELVLVLHAIELVSLGTVMVVLVIWARDPHLWDRAIDFRTWASVASLPFIGLAFLESLRLSPAETEWRHRTRTLVLVGLIFVVVLSVQSLSWVNLTGKLQQALGSRADSCLPASSFQFVNETALGHWSLGSYVLLSQGRQPGKAVVVGNTNCLTQDFSQGLTITDWDRRGWQTPGWFDLTALKQRLMTEQSSPTTCRFMPTTGWYKPERDGSNWWRWSEGRGKIELLSPQAGLSTMLGSFASFQQPNQIDIMVNGQKQATLAINWSGARISSPLSLELKKGRNTLEFVSQNPAVRPAGETRSLAIMLGDLNLTTAGATTSCELQN